MAEEVGDLGIKEPFRGTDGAGVRVESGKVIVICEHVEGVILPFVAYV